MVGFFRQLGRNLRNAGARVNVSLHLSDADIHPDYSFDTDGLAIRRGFQAVRDYLLKPLRASPVASTERLDDNYAKANFWPLVLDATVKTRPEAQGGLAPAQQLTEVGLCFLAECAFAEYQDQDMVSVRLHDDGTVSVYRIQPDAWDLHRRDLGNFRQEMALLDRLGVR